MNRVLSLKQRMVPICCQQEDELGMEGYFRLYFFIIKDSMPQSVYAVLLIIFCVGTAILFQRNGRKIRRELSLLLFFEYIIYVFLFTVVYRTEGNIRRYECTPFWSYDKTELQVQIILNVLAFIPIGILLGCAFKGIRWWSVLFIGAGLSFSIEVIQFIMKRGFSELDDIIHNTLGCMIGYGIYSIIFIACNKLKNNVVK